MADTSERHQENDRCANLQGYPVFWHFLVHQNDSTVFDNSTLNGGTVAHVGQLFFDDDLVTQVDEISPYSTNTQEMVENADDSIFAEEADTFDPIVEYVLLGDDLSDGILAWGSFGINVTEANTVSNAATLTENGGVANENSGMGGGPGGSGVPSGFPSGSGTPPSASASA